MIRWLKNKIACHLFITIFNWWVVVLFLLFGILYLPSAALGETADGIHSWFVQRSELPFPLNDVYFIDALTGWVVRGWQGGILKTDDGGDTWTIADGKNAKSKTGKVVVIK